MVRRQQSATKTPVMRRGVSNSPWATLFDSQTEFRRHAHELRRAAALAATQQRQTLDAVETIPATSNHQNDNNNPSNHPGNTMTNNNHPGNDDDDDDGKVSLSLAKQKARGGEKLPPTTTTTKSPPAKKMILKRVRAGDQQ